jgi:hypothetical protein
LGENDFSSIAFTPTDDGAFMPTGTNERRWSCTVALKDVSINEKEDTEGHIL